MHYSTFAEGWQYSARSPRGRQKDVISETMVVFHKISSCWGGPSSADREIPSFEDRIIKNANKRFEAATRGNNNTHCEEKEKRFAAAVQVSAITCKGFSLTKGTTQYSKGQERNTGNQRENDDC
jgi:hypothetical protein